MKEKISRENSTTFVDSSLAETELLATPFGKGRKNVLSFYLCFYVTFSLYQISLSLYRVEFCDGPFFVENRFFFFRRKIERLAEWAIFKDLVFSSLVKKAGLP